MDGDVPLSEIEAAVIQGNTELVKLLVRQDTFDPESEEAQNVLYSAAETCNWDLVSFLLQEANICEHSVDAREVVFQHAAQAGQLPLLHMLVAKGVSCQSAGASRALISSAACGHLDVLEFLIKQGANVHLFGTEATLSGANASVWGAVLKLLNADADLNEQTLFQLFALASIEGQSLVVDWLHHKHRLNFQSNGATQALKVLSSTQQWERCWKAVRYLVEKGVAVNSEGGDSALLTASVCGDIEMVKLLVESGASLDSDAASDALERAGELGSPMSTREIAEYLRAKGVREPPAKQLVIDAYF